MANKFTRCMTASWSVAWKKLKPAAAGSLFPTPRKKSRRREK